MADLKKYEVRLRGEFMMNGKIIHAESHKMAARKLYKINKKINNKKIDCIVIDTTTGNWGLVFLNDYPKGHMFSTQGYAIKIDGQIIHPVEYSPEKRLAIAKECEASSQEYEETARLFKLKNAPSKPNLEFANFDDQLKKYKEEQKNSIIGVNNMAAAQCLKECTIAEVAIIIGDTTKAEKAITIAKIFYEEIKTHPEMANSMGDAISNAVNKTSISVQKQFDKTAKKIEKFKNETVSTNKTTALGIN